MTVDSGCLRQGAHPPRAEQRDRGGRRPPHLSVGARL